jgi:hypothetical protein
MKYLFQDFKPLVDFASQNRLNLYRSSNLKSANFSRVEYNQIEETLIYSQKLWGDLSSYYLILDESPPSDQIPLDHRIDGSNSIEGTIILAYSDGGLIVITPRDVVIAGSESHAEWWRPK